MNIGLVLSGGGARGAAHIGVIKALSEHKIHPSHISGTSAGAIVGALYAAGVDWSEMLNFFKTITLFNRHKYAYRKPGFIDTDKFYNSFKVYFKEDNFAALQKPLYITATDIVKGTLKIFNTGELIRVVLASASFPGVFTPMEIEGSYYVDGGTLNNFPVEPLKNDCDKIIGVFVNPLKKIEIENLKHSYNVVERAYKIKSVAESAAKFSDCDLIVKPEVLSDYSTFSMNNVQAIFEIGYTSTIALLKKNKLFIDN
ncbi:patatin-like phospholipase family protein [Aureibaculum luteum]|uniref:patatin-like phospholipase family protein n=1 Tax=Aureibaculum luteum TaxID=1548456 RepID=UPI000E47EF7A|nr:patatin-like phospholipase family protein [Aureibaculum luteum]